MSRNSIKAVDLFCRILNWNNSIENSYEDERPRWTKQRDRHLAKFRKVMAKITQDEFLAGRGASLETWNEMKALMEDD